MTNLLWIIVALPFVGSLILTLAGGKLSRLGSAFVGIGSIVLSAIVTILIGIDFIQHLETVSVYNQVLWKWIDIAGFSPDMAFHLDTVSMTFIFVVTFVGALIHLYSAQFMWKDEGFVRFFSFMNLFIGCMLILVLADNLLFLYLGWEGVTLCSYLLIGYWYKDPSNDNAARKAFLITRIGDVSLIIALLILFMTFHTLNINNILQIAPDTWSVGSGIAITTAFLILGGALAKSAQLPLQTWLVDAMAAPSPVSALLHAATMVTAGVYIIARTHVLFELAPVVLNWIAIIGAVTLLVAGLSALYQHNIKRVLAYSTISQIGYMFLALGVGAWSAAIFHFMIQAFFKALLFLGAGVVIWSLQDEHNMFKMGGLRKKMPIVFWTFLIGSASLAALPLITAGFYSKDKILWMAYSSETGSTWLWIAGLVGALITALYTFRMVFLTFYGKAKVEPTRRLGIGMSIPLIILAFLSLVGGFIDLPETFGNFTPFSNFIEKTLPLPQFKLLGDSTEWILQLIAAIVAIGGIILAYKLYYNKASLNTEPKRNAWQQFLFKGWDFDLLYNKIIVNPLVFQSRIDKEDFINGIYDDIALGATALHRALSFFQNGKVRRYAMVMAIGVIITLTIILYL